MKHEQQNHFIYEYIDKLNRDIEDINDSIECLRLKVEEQKESNQTYLQELGTTPKKELARAAAQKFEESCQKDIEALEGLLREAEPELRKLGLGEELTQFNLTEELAKVEEMIDCYFVVGEEVNGTFHEEATRYTRVPPGYS